MKMEYLRDLLKNTIVISWFTTSISKKLKTLFKREKEIKKWRREKKNNLINSFNPDWNFLNDKIKENL